MATELVATGEGSRTSSDVVVDQGSILTLIPRFDPGGRVVVQIKDSDDGYHIINTLYSTGPKDYQVKGPCTIRVSARNAGCDAETGA